VIPAEINCSQENQTSPVLHVQRPFSFSFFFFWLTSFLDLKAVWLVVGGVVDRRCWVGNSASLFSPLADRFLAACAC